MTKQHIATHGRRWWTNVLQWVRAMEDAGDTCEVALLERRVRVLDAAVAEMRHGPDDRAGREASPPPVA